jgi:uncharacterized membrane protein
MASPVPRDDATSRDTARVEAFSDGVIAIAITLLIIEIGVPHIASGESDGNRALLEALLDLWPSYLGYFVSFLTIGIMWINHHNIFSFINRTDQKFLALNLLLLLCIAFLPFPTAVMAEYLGEPGQRTAVVLYGASFTVSAVFYYLLWSYSSRGRRLIDPSVDQRAIDAVERRYRLGAPLYLAGTLVAAVVPLVGMLVFLALDLFYVLPYLLPSSGGPEPPG